MLLVLCVDRDDDLGRKTEAKTPVVGETRVREAAVELATADPEDSDVNVLFEGLRIADSVDEPVEIAAITGEEGRDIEASRQIRRQLDWVLAGLEGEDSSAIVVTDGAQDESVLPVIRSRVTVDGVSRVVVRQAQDLESMYYTIKQVLDDPETRGTILVPLGILLLIYPAAVVANALDLPGSSLGLVSTLLGLYVLSRGLGLEESIDSAVEQIRTALYTGRVTVVTSVAALALFAVGLVSGRTFLQTLPIDGLLQAAAAVTYGAVDWIAAGGIVAALGRVTDEYLADGFRWRYLNAPFYVLAIAVVVHALSAFLLGLEFATLRYLAVALAGGTLLGVASTLAFAVAESRFQEESPTAT